MKKRFMPFILAWCAAVVCGSLTGRPVDPFCVLGCSRKTPEQKLAGRPVALSGYLQNGPASKVVFIGLDGVSWNVIDPMIERGELPTFKMLKEGGAWCDLRSTDCFISSAAWPAMMTGCNPEKVGVYSFAKIDSFEGELLPADARDVMVPSVWDIASAAGLKTAVVNVPLTYPVRPVNGIMVSGFLTPGVVPVKRAPTTIMRCYRAGVREASKFTGVSSHSVPLKAKKNIFRNKFTIYLLDMSADGANEYDTACLIIDPVQGKRIEAELSQRVFCKIDSLSPWVKLNYATEGGQKWGWARIKVRYNRPVNEIEVDAYPVYFDLADTSVAICYPERLRADMIRDLTRYFPYTGYLKSDILNFVHDKEEYLNYFHDYDDWDFFLFEFQEPDKMLHEDGDGPYTQELHRRVDAVLGRFIAGLPDDITLFIASDHGFTPYARKIGLNAWFDSLGLLARDDQGKMDRSRSFVFHFEWNIYVNRSLLEREHERIPGFVVPDGVSVYEAFLDYLIDLGAGFTAPGSGVPMPLRFFRYPAGSVGSVPDLLVHGGYDGYRVLMIDNPDRAKQVVIDLDTSGEIWYHRPEGLFIAYGNTIQKGLHLPAKSITDVAPTMLYALGLPSAAYFDGRVVEEMFDTAFRNAHPLRIYAYFEDVQEIDRAEKSGDREKLEDKLRAIGYIE